MPRFNDNQALEVVLRLLPFKQITECMKNKKKVQILYNKVKEF